MQTKHLIIVIIILEICFLSWTSFLDNRNLNGRGENIFLAQNTISTVTLTVLKKHSNDSISKIPREETYEVNHNYLDLKGKKIRSLLILSSPLSEEEEYENGQTVNTLNQITHIDVSNNYLTSFPLYLFEMEQLKEVYLGNNRIKFVDSGLSFLEESTSIETLDLSNNDLANYSTAGLKLPNLQYLNLNGNLDLVDVFIKKGHFLHLKELNIKNTMLSGNLERIAELHELLPDDVKMIY